MVGVGQGRDGHSWACSILGLRGLSHLPLFQNLLSQEGGNKHICVRPGVYPALMSLDRIRGAPTLPVEASRLGNREAILGPALRNSHEGEARPREKNHMARSGLYMSCLSLACDGPQPGRLSSGVFASGWTVEAIALRRVPRSMIADWDPTLWAGEWRP